MLRARIEIVPFGWEDDAREVATLTIGLKGIDDGVGTYDSTLKTDGKGPQPANEEVKGLRHERRLGACELVARCLNAHLG